MKKIFISVILSQFVFSLYSQTNKEELIQKARNFENNKEWIYALATYDEADDYQSFNLLKQEIESGNPGKGTFDIFSIHDEWLSLIKKFQKYFSENCPYEIRYKDLALEKINYENKTASYYSDFEFRETKLFSELSSALKEGIKIYDKKYKDSIPEELNIYSLNDDKDVGKKVEKIY